MSCEYNHEYSNKIRRVNRNQINPSRREEKNICLKIHEMIKTPLIECDSAQS